MALYGAGAQQVVTVTGNEQIPVDTGGSVEAFMTSGQVAALAGSGSNLASTALNTVGAGTITAAGIAGRWTVRGGAQSNAAFTDTSATAAQITAALPASFAVGQSFLWYYQNTTNATATLAGGTGVTLSDTVLSGTTATFLVTRTGATTYTVVKVEATSPVGSSGTFVCNGTTPVTVTDSRVTANSAIVVTLKTVGGTVGAVPAVKTITAGTGFTIAGTASDTSTYNYLILG